VGANVRSTVAQFRHIGPLTKIKADWAWWGFTAAWVGASYFAVAQLSLLLLKDGVAVFWPAARIASGVLIVLGPRARAPMVLGVVIASVAANLLGDRNIGSSVVFSIANAGEAVLVAELVSRFCPAPFHLDQLNRVISLFGAIFAATTLSSIVGTIGFVLFHPSDAPLFLTWLHWAASASLGGITVAPLAIAVASLRACPPTHRELVEAVGLLSVITALCGMMVLLPNESWTRELALASFCPLVVVLAARGPAPFTSVATFVWCITIVWSTTFGVGIFGDHSLSLDERIIFAQATLLATCFGALILAALFSERRERELDLSKAKQSAELANQAKSEFLAAASHDLRQPLQTMKLLIQLLDDRQRDDEGRELINDLSRCLHSMSNILTSLLNLNRLETGETHAQKSTFCLKDILEPLAAEIRPLIYEKGLTLRTVNSEVAVFSDKHLLAEMIRNLLTNAVRYTDQGTILLGCRCTRESVAIQVWDTGIGIAKDEIPRIFHKYYKSANAGDRGGLGWGLAIVRRLGEILGHEVDVQSTPGKGAAFSIYVPKGTLPPRSVRSRQPRPKYSERKPLPDCVLLVEDDNSVRVALVKILNASGIQVLTAATSEKALELVHQSELRPAVIVCDYNLRGSANGIQTIKSIRKTMDEPIPAIVITGETRSNYMHEIASLGASILVKPFRGEQLVDTIARLFTQTSCAEERRVQQNAQSE
jgi:signal transduction histidine kinase/CheY-like chemotaxis protein